MCKYHRRCFNYLVNRMRKFFIIVCIFLIVPASQAQFGIGASGGLLYPGLISSDPSGSQFKIGGGYELFFRHGLFSFGDSSIVSARYAYRYNQNMIELPYVLDTHFKFKYLSVNLFADIYKYCDLSMYTGFGVSLVTINAEKDFYQFTDTQFVPEIILGSEWMFYPHHNIFAEISFQYGQLKDVLGESISLAGIRFVLGITMFLVNQDES